MDYAKTRPVFDGYKAARVLLILQKVMRKLIKPDLFQMKFFVLIGKVRK